MLAIIPECQTVPRSSSSPIPLKGYITVPLRLQSLGEIVSSQFCWAPPELARQGKESTYNHAEQEAVLVGRTRMNF